MKRPRWGDYTSICRRHKAFNSEEISTVAVGNQSQIAIHSQRLSFLPKARPRRTGGRRPEWRHVAKRRAPKGYLAAKDSHTPSVARCLDFAALRSTRQNARWKPSPIPQRTRHDIPTALGRILRCRSGRGASRPGGPALPPPLLSPGDAGGALGKVLRLRWRCARDACAPTPKKHRRRARRFFVKNKVVKAAVLV